MLSGNNGSVGGFVGFEDGWSGALYQNCYATGHVENTGTGNSANGFGSKQGESSIDACFWDMETSGMDFSQLGTGKSTAEMKTKSTFTLAGWDFGTVWNMDGVTNDGYPFVRGTEPETPVTIAETTFTYDERGRLHEESLTYDGQTYTTIYDYDSADRLKTVTYPNQQGEMVEQDYSDRGLPKTLKFEGTDDYLVSDMQYNPLGQVKQIDLGDVDLNNVVRTIYGYWGVGGDNDNPGGYYGNLWRIRTTKDGNPLQDIEHTWDASSNLTQRHNVVTGETETFTYDFLDRIKTAAASGGSTSYSRSYGYDKLGNIQSANGRTYLYEDPAHKHAVTSAGTNSYTYDANGNMEQRVSHNQKLQWDEENRLVKVTNLDDMQTQATFAYDAFGDRLLKEENGERVLYVNSYFEKNLTTGKETSHYYLGGQEVAFRKVTDDGSSTLEYVHTDHLGSTVFTTDSNGGRISLEQDQQYYPFGSKRQDTDPLLDTDKKFTGQRLDQTGLYFYNARYYDAEIGRFISADTIVPNPADPQNFNRYTYCLNNPLKYTDPSGHFLDTLFDIGSAVYDVYTIIKYPTDWENWAALGADIGCAFIPFVAGGGVAVRGATHADEAYDVYRGINQADNAYRAVNAGGDAARIGGANVVNEVSQAAVMRQLRQSGTRESLATASLIKRGKVRLNFVATDPFRMGAAGRASWAPGRDVYIAMDKVRNARRAAGIAAHESRHILQGITPDTYRLMHELDAYQWQRAAGFLNATDQQIIHNLNTNPLYSHVSW
ncbi:MAG: RHS repeat-associated core domain-containing protein [Dehalococcoidia bacterium]|nr:RHS repeat-associated core domain-containing protein [Dehalococcoidia bacterium]